MSRTQQEAVLAAVEELHGVLSLARTLLMAGRQLDLRGLEKEVARLCDRVSDLPEDRRKATRPALASLLAQLDAVARQIAQDEAGTDAPRTRVEG